METESLESPFRGHTPAFVGVFDPRPTEAGRAIAIRTSVALAPGEAAGELEDGPLAVAWSRGIACRIEDEESCRCWLDGHLYNSEELARELRLPGGVDPVELLAAGYATHGAKLLERLRGDFSLLLWDPRSATGILARDHLGGRALFIHRAGRALAFGSELRNLVAMLPRTPGPDEVAVANHLVSSVIPEDRTFYSGIEEVPPATVLELGHHDALAQRYWTVRHRYRRALSASEAAERSRELIERAVVRRAAAGRESAILLSGGIDSAGVAGVATRRLLREQRPTRSYSAIFPRYPEIDEERLISIVAANAGLEATGVDAEPGGMLRAALPYIATWLAPPLTPNVSFLRPLLDRAAADGTRVLFDGEGGDALFWYAPSLIAHRLQRGRLFSAWQLAGRFPEYGIPTSWRTRLNKLRQWGRRRDFTPAAPSWLAVSRELLEAGSGVPVCGEGPFWWREGLEGILGPGSRMVHDVTRRGCALSGIEPRHPLLDVDLIEEVLSFPPDLAFDRRYNRPVLRAALAGHVPDEVRLRPYKSNFDAVIAAGTDADLPVFKAVLLSPGAHVAAYTDRSAVTDLLDRRPGGQVERRERANGLWRLATAECLLRVQAGEKILPTRAGTMIRTPEYSFSRL